MKSKSEKVQKKKKIYIYIYIYIYISVTKFILHSVKSKYTQVINKTDNKMKAKPRRFTHRALHQTSLTDLSRTLVMLSLTQLSTQDLLNIFACHYHQKS